MRRSQGRGRDGSKVHGADKETGKIGSELIEYT